MRTVRADPLTTDPVEIEYRTPAGVRVAVGVADAGRIEFERCPAVRSFPAYKGQRHFSGLWWSATQGAHVGFESWLERDHLMLMDFDPLIAGISSQPFWLVWQSGSGKAVSHAPDYFARRADGSAAVVDCRPLDRRPDRDAAKFAATEAVCDRAGWEYRLVGEPDPVLVANVRWLAGYRHPRHKVPDTAKALREAFASGCPLMQGAAAVGDPIAVLPVLFHLLWNGSLRADLTCVLHEGTAVSVGAAA
jgi:hypothetical protein